MLNNDHAAFEAAQSRAAAAVSCESVVLPSGLTVLCRTMPGYSSVHAIYATGFGSIHRAFKLDGKQVTLPAGTVESIAELTPQMLYSCTKAFYAPSNMVLSVAGKITLAQAVDACKRNGLYRARAPHEVEWAIPAQSGPLPHREAVFTMPVTKPCFGVAYREEPLAEGDTKRELLLDMLGDLVVGGLTKLYRRLYDEALVNPEFSGDFIAVRGACAVAFTGESDTPREVVDLLQAEIERMRRDGVDPEVFMLVKNQMYGELLGDVEAVDDAAEEAAAACLKGRTLADEIAALAELTVDDANALLRTALREENRAYVQIDPAEA